MPRSQYDNCANDIGDDSGYDGDVSDYNDGGESYDADDYDGEDEDDSD
jgi:hypothetical protein